MLFVTASAKALATETIYGCETNTNIILYIIVFYALSDLHAPLS